MVHINGDINVNAVKAASTAGGPPLNAADGCERIYCHLPAADCASIGTAALQVFANSSSSPHQRTVACRASSSLGARIAVPRDTGPVGILAPHMVVHGPHLSRRASHGVSTPTRGCVRLVPSPTSAHDLIHSNWTAAAQPTTARIIQCEPIAALQLFRRQATPRLGPQWQAHASTLAHRFDDARRRSLRPDNGPASPTRISD
jgi:hypothetical protein